jgi:integrase
MAWTNVEGWSHGRVWVDSAGRRTFYIRKRRGGKAFNVSTRCSTLRGALVELERWEKNPDEYRPQGSEERLLLTEGLIDQFDLWCERESGATDPRWRAAKVGHLRWWSEKLAGRDLRGLPLTALHDALRGASDTAKRIVSIKHLFSWLRKTGRLHASDDPTVGALPVPQAKVSQDVGGSKVVPEADFRATLAHLDDKYADAAQLQAATGIHVSEVIRFAKDGAVIDSIPGGAVLAFQHKGGHVHRVAVSPEVAEVAKRVRARPPVNRNVYYRAVKAACVDAKVEPWTPGRFRATFATRAVERGASPAAVALALGHKGSATTLKWYATTAVAPRVEGGIEPSAETAEKKDTDAG